MNWWSSVASAKALMRDWSIANHSPTPSSLPTCLFQSSSAALAWPICRSPSSVGTTEQVVGIDRPLQTLAPRERGGREHRRQEALAQLADAVVVRERSAIAQDLLTRRALEFRVDLARVLDTAVIECEVEIDAHACLVELRHARGDERPARQPALGVLLPEPLLHVLDQRH